MVFKKWSKADRIVIIISAIFLGAIIGLNNIYVGLGVVIISALQIEVMINIYKNQAEDWWDVSWELFNDQFKYFSIVCSFLILFIAVIYAVFTNVNTFTSFLEFRINSLEGFYSALITGVCFYVVILFFKCISLLRRSMENNTAD